MDLASSSTFGKVFTKFVIILCGLFLFYTDGETHWDGTHQTMTDSVSVTFINDRKQQCSDFLQQKAPDKDRTYLDLLKQGVRDADLRVNGIYAVDKHCSDISKSSCPESEKVANNIPEVIVGDHYFHPKTLKGRHSLPDLINRVYKDWDGWTGDGKIRETLISLLPGKTLDEKKNTLINLMKEANAAKLAEFFYNRALTEWKNNHPGDAFYNLGIALHVVQDLTVPHHSKLIINGGNYEQYVQEIYLKSVKGRPKIVGLYLQKSPTDWIKTIAEKSYEWSTDPKVSAGNSFFLGVSASAGFLMSFFKDAGISVSEVKVSSKIGSPPIPYEDYGICSGEACGFGEWVACQNMEIRKERDKDSPIAFQIAKGEKVTALTGVVITTKPGRATVLKSLKIGNFQADPGDNIYLLTYRGEGIYNVWFKGRMYNNLGDKWFDNLFAPGYLKVLDRPETTDWVQIQNSKGQIGWRRLSPQSYFDYKYGCE